MSLTLRDQLIRACWVPSDFRKPPPDARGAHYPVQVWGVIDDPAFRPEEGELSPFVDIVSWWPASQIWTVTFQCRRNPNAEDYPVLVSWWQPLPPLVLP